jgi:pimeloyl-ACP methyl ester carboxylesterase
VEQSIALRASDGSFVEAHHQLLLFDPAGDGRIVEMFGQLTDRTQNVGILVPGTSADLNGFAIQSDRAAGFAKQSPDGSLVTIAWLGYDAPDSVLRDAPLNHYADEGGRALRDFVQGLGVDGPKVTLAGHSYGGAVVGAAEREGLLADRVLHVESAGASIDNISQYPHQADRYSMTAPGDFIALVQGTVDADADNPSDDLGHGLDPDELPGAVRLETGRRDATDPHSPMLRGFSSHSEVFTEGSHAWRNMFEVMNGGKVLLYSPPRETFGYPAYGVVYPMEDPDFDPPRVDIP